MKVLNSTNENHYHGGDYEAQNKGISLHKLLYYLCASSPLHASVCMCKQYFESHHEFVLMVTTREWVSYLVDTSCGDGVNQSHVKSVIQVRYDLNMPTSQES